MVIGALIASGDDLTFNWFGYTFLTVNNLCTAAQGVVIKQKLVNKVKGIAEIRLISIRICQGFESKWTFILQFTPGSWTDHSLRVIYRRSE